MTKNQVEPLFYARERVKGGIKALTKQREGSLDWGSNVISCPDKEELCKVTRGGMLRKVPPFIYHLLIYSFLWLLYFTANRMLNFRLLICMFVILKHSFTRSFSCHSEATNYLLFTWYNRRLQESYCRAIFILDHTHTHLSHTHTKPHKVTHT